MDFVREAIQVANGSTVQELESSARFAIAMLVDPSESTSSSPKVPSSYSTVDACSMIYADALKHQMNEAAFVDCLGSSALSTEKSDVLAKIYSSALHLPSLRGVVPPCDLATLHDGFFPKVVGVQWSLVHQLGNRTVAPPVRSMPHFTFQFQIDGADSLSVHCSAEEAQDLLNSFKDMLKETERLVL